MTSEKQFIEAQLHELRELRGTFPVKYDEAQKQVTKHIDDLCEKAGILAEIKRAKDELERFRLSVQRQADEVTGRISAYETVFDQFHRVPVEPGQMKHGIDLSTLGWETRLKVMNDHRDTIAALGGTFEEPAPAEPVQPGQPDYEEPTLVQVEVVSEVEEAVTE